MAGLPEENPSSTVGTLRCLLCGGAHVFPGPKYASHLLNEHGVVFELDFVVQATLHKRDRGTVSGFWSEDSHGGGCVRSEATQVDLVESKDFGCRTDFSVGSGAEASVAADFDDKMAGDEEAEELVTNPGEAKQDDVAAANPVQKTEEEPLRQQELTDEADQALASRSDASLADKKRRTVGRGWAPHSFSSSFACYFCNEQFPKDYKLKIHLAEKHRNENADDVAKALEELTKSKLDGCVHQCAMCGSRYNSISNFTRHIKDVHNMSRAQYRQSFGNSEVESTYFKCELCDKELKRTRNIIGAHMKMVHLISWREYQDILMKIRQGGTVVELPVPQLFDCTICGIRVKYKREHLSKKHQVTGEAYDAMIAQKNQEAASTALQKKECRRSLFSDKDDDNMVVSNDESKYYLKQMVADGSSNAVGLSGQNQSMKKEDDLETIPEQLSLEESQCIEPIITEPTPGGGAPTDLQCYFGCNEFFRKDYQLYLHLKLRHSSEDPEEMKRAYQAAEEEIALTRRSASVYQCSLCNKQFTDNGAFYSHIQTKHNLPWKEYRERFGRCEIESKPFECTICTRVIKYDRNTVHTHLKHVHGITWPMYLDRIRKLRRGEVPDALPVIEVIECRVCKISVKYLREHLRNAHKITEQQYESTFKGNAEDGDNTNSPLDMVKVEENVCEPESVPSPQQHCAEKPPKSDIQNKTNKTCSTCVSTFDSRRSFIEHCTTVHNMRFKTKSGATISASVLQWLQQPETTPSPPSLPHKKVLKRKSVESRPEQVLNLPKLPLPPAMKVPKFSSVEDNAFENAKALSQYTPKGVCKWNQCRYECCFCKKTTMSRSSMTSHIHARHGIPVKEYKESNYPDIEVETNWFQCRLCSGRTKFVKDCISPHLRMTHNMDLKVYERDFMLPEDWPRQTGPRSTMRSDPFSSSLPETASTGNIANFGPEVEQEAIVRVVKADKWNKCQFRCCLCEWICTDSRSMRAHIASSHWMKYEAYVEEYGTSEVVTERFQCKLCGSEMKHCRQNIYAHMKDVHKMSLADYERQVDIEEEEELAFQEPSSPATEMSAAPPKALKTSRWNRCRFQCAICLKLSSERRQTREHILKFHGLTMSAYEAVHGDCEVHTEFFTCGVCKVEVKHNMKNVYLHLLNIHQMSLTKYEAQFGRLPEVDVETEQQDASPPPPLPPPLDSIGEEFGFGSHFMVDGNADKESLNSDFRSPECKFCRICNRIFNRRQAFLEHCRNAHDLRIKGSERSKLSKSAAVQKATFAPKQNLNASDAGGYPCDYCGKSFSSRSNMQRHVMLACERLKNSAVSSAHSDAGDERPGNTKKETITSVKND